MVIPFEIVPQQVLSKNRSKLPEDSDNDSDEAEFVEYSPMLSFKKFKRELTNYCVKFFHDDSYIWLSPKNLNALPLAQIEAFLSKVNSKTSKKLVRAYEMAKQGVTSGIDVWEFVEYGSSGKPDDDDYTEGEGEDDYAEDDEGSSKRKPTRSSARTKAKKAKPAPRRATRSNTKVAQSAKTGSSGGSGSGSGSEDASSLDEDEEEERKPVASKPRAKAAKRAPKPLEKPKQTVYRYEDDDDWRIVGLGPQDLTLDSHPSFASKLIVKRNLEVHNDLKLELKDRLAAVNRMLTEFILDKSEDSDLIYLIMDELKISISLKGSNDELWSVFFANSELLLNLRILLNLKRTDLKKLKVLDKLLDIYEEIYDNEFQFDTKPWSKDAQIVDPTPEPSQDSAASQPIETSV